MSKIKCTGVLLAVSNIERSKKFYQTVMEQEILIDTGNMVDFKEIFVLYENYPELVAGGGKISNKPTGAALKITEKPNNFQLAFEVDDLDSCFEKIKSTEGIEILHDISEYSWGQRVFRFYDYDKHIVEVGEDLVVVIKRFLSQGLSLEAVAERLDYPIEVVQKLLQND